MASRPRGVEAKEETEWQSLSHSKTLRVSSCNDEEDLGRGGG